MIPYRSRRHHHLIWRIRHSFGFSGNYGFSNIVLWSNLATWGFFGLIGLILLTIILFIWYSKDLPAPGKLVSAQLSNSTRIYDRNGVLLYSVFQNENRIYVTLPNIPKYLQEATIAVEDKNFYTNPGFDFMGYLRAIRDIVFLRGVTGGSGLTQQLVRNTLISSERTLPRKIKELILSIQVNQKYSKDQILEMYLNDVGYGGANVGVEAASEAYFGKHASDLDLAQSALLAGLPQSPTVYSPYRPEKYYVGRAHVVLNQMVANHYIAQQQDDNAFNEIQRMTFTQENAAGIKAPWAVMYIKQKLAQQFGDEMVENGGLQVTTTIDYSIEQKAEQIVKDELDKIKNYHVANGAAVVTDPKTGQVLAIVGNKDYFDKESQGNFNDALAMRQPGSSLKPIMYSVAFEKGYTPASMVMDSKTDFPSNDPTNPIYTPVNYDEKYRGPVQLRFALGNSLNLPAVKMLARVGIKDVMQQGYEMGISNWQPTTDNLASVGLSLVLGGRETTLLDETTAYGVFATEGIRHDPVFVLKVKDSKGNTLYEDKPTNGVRVLSQEVSFLISHILLDNNARSMEFGPNSWLVVPGRTVSVKTGTTDSKRDNWTVGYTPSYVVGVWVGNNDNTVMNQAIASGVTGASPIWNKIMSAVLKGKPDEQPQKPDNVVAVQVDSLFGGLPYNNFPSRSEYFIKGTEPTSSSPVYKSKDGKIYYFIHEDDPVSTDGQNRWQAGIDQWIKDNHSAADAQWYPPSDVLTPNPTPTNQSNNQSPTPTPTSTPTPTPTNTPTPTPTP